METLTVEFLKRQNFYDRSTIDFLERNKLFGMPLEIEFVKSIKGDYKRYKSELLCKLEAETTYGENGYVIKRRYSNGSVYTFSHDDKGNCVEVEHTYGNIIKDVWQQQFDKQGNLIYVTFPSGRVGECKHNQEGNLVRLILPNGNFIKYHYDKYGNIEKKTTPGGKVIKYKYDAKGNRIERESPDGDVTEWEYTYHPNGQLYRIHENCELTLEIPLFENKNN